MQSRLSIFSVAAALALLLAGNSQSSAQVSLGTAQSFSVLGASTVTNTNTTTVIGNLGLNPGSSVTGFPPGMVVGEMHVTNAVALQARLDAITAYNTLAGMACDFDLTGQDLGGLTLVPGVYCFATSAQLTGSLTLDALGNPDALFVFQIGTTLTTASSATVSVINGGTGCNVYWQIGTSATLGSSSSFLGTLIADASITMNTTAVLTGRALALNGAVTLDSNLITMPAECAVLGSSGEGCVGSGDITPTLSLTTPLPGFDVTLEISDALGGSMAIIYFGTPASHFNACGCELLVRPSPLELLVPLTGSGAGNGTFTLSGMMPPGFVGEFMLQAFVKDPGAPCGYSSTNALTVSIQ